MNNFKPVYVEGRDLDEVWFKLLSEVYNNGRRYKITSGSFAGSERLAFDYVSGAIMYPHSRPLSPTVPEGVPRPTTDTNIEEYFTNYLMDSTLSKNEHYKYASYIVGNNDVCKTNQIQWVIDHFKSHGYGNEHASVVIGSPDSCLAYDWPFMKCEDCGEYFKKGVNTCSVCGGKLTMEESRRGTSPCLRLLDFRVIDNCLTTHVVYRSWDLYAGWPENMGGFALLNEYVANELDIEPGPLTFSCKSLHCYDYQIDALKMRLKKE